MWGEPLGLDQLSVEINTVAISLSEQWNGLLHTTPFTQPSPPGPVKDASSIAVGQQQNMCQFFSKMSAVCSHATTVLVRVYAV